MTAFSRDPGYVELNRAFVRAVATSAGTPRRVVDLACGDGLLTALLQAELPAEVVGIDRSRRGLEAAAAALDGRGGRGGPGVLLVEATGDRLPLADARVDLVVLGNAIHCFPDTQALTAEVARVLRPGGRFAFNTCFYAGTIVAGSELYYQGWLQRAVRQAGPAPRAGGGRRAFSNRWLTPEEYGAALTAAGFAVLAVVQRTFPMTSRQFEGLAGDGGTWEDELVSTLLPGYPAEAARSALHAAVEPTFQALGIEQVPRRWLEVIGGKPS